MQGDQAAAMGSSGVLEPTAMAISKVSGGHREAGAWKTLSELSSFLLSASSPSFKDQGLKYDEAPGQQRKPNSITVKSNSGSRMDAHEEQARAGGSFQSQMWGSGG